MHDYDAAEDSKPANQDDVTPEPSRKGTGTCTGLEEIKERPHIPAPVEDLKRVDPPQELLGNQLDAYDSAIGDPEDVPFPLKEEARGHSHNFISSPSRPTVLPVLPRVTHTPS